MEAPAQGRGLHDMAERVQDRPHPRFEADFLMPGEDFAKKSASAEALVRNPRAAIAATEELERQRALENERSRMGLAAKNRTRAGMAPPRR